MIKKLKNIFQYIPIPKSNEAESNKISYWLEKLFNQEKQELDRKKEERKDVWESKRQSTLRRTTEKSTTENVHAPHNMEEKGIDEAHKNHSRHREVDTQRLDDLVSKSNRILMSISSMFPWDMFVSTINVEDTRVTIIHRQLFSSQVHSIDIKDIHNVFIDTSLIFASLTIVSRTFVQNELTIGKLRKKKAIMIRRIIEGLRMFVKGDIDTTVYTKEELLTKLQELSTTKIVL